MYECIEWEERLLFWFLELFDKLCLQHKYIHLYVQLGSYLPSTTKIVVIWCPFVCCKQSCNTITIALLVFCSTSITYTTTTVTKYKIATAVHCITSIIFFHPIRTAGALFKFRIGCKCAKCFVCCFNITTFRLFLRLINFTSHTTMPWWCTTY